GIYRLGRCPQGRRSRMLTTAIGQSGCDVGPLTLGRLYNSARIGEEGSARLLAVKKIEPLAENDPKQGMAGNRPVVADGDRIITPKARRIDLRMPGKGATIAFIRKTPDGASQFKF